MIETLTYGLAVGVVVVAAISVPLYVAWAVRIVVRSVRR